tara:strand:- start:503 stop:676 length:174 start_codon:yes stop_codon:yes gene_type:complete
VFAKSAKSFDLARAWGKGHCVSPALLARTVGNNYEKHVSKENITSDNDVDFFQLICL